MEGADKTPISMTKVIKEYQDKKDIQLKSSSQAINIIHDVFISAAEREIHTGDGISLKVIVIMSLHRSFFGIVKHSSFITDVLKCR